MCAFCDDYVMKGSDVDDIDLKRLEPLAHSQKLHSHPDTEVTAATEVTWSAPGRESRAMTTGQIRTRLRTGPGLNRG